MLRAWGLVRVEGGVAEGLEFCSLAVEALQLKGSGFRALGGLEG